MLELVATTVGYAQGFELGITATHICPGEIIAVVGPSGSGKSTFLHSVAGVLDAHNCAPHSIAQSYIMHEPHLLPWRSVRGHIDAESAIRGRPFNHAGFKAHLIAVGLPLTVLDFRPRELSLGMRQRIEFLIALDFGVDLILGDEVFSGVDQANKCKMMRLAVDYVSQGDRILFFTSHFPVDVLRIATRILAIENGRIAALSVQFDQPASERVELNLDALLRLPQLEPITCAMS